MKYLILSVHKGEFNPEFALWWSPDCAGYTVDVDKAGRYNSDECSDVVKRGHGVLIPEDLAIKMIRQVVPRTSVWAQIKDMKSAAKKYRNSLK